MKQVLPQYTQAATGKQHIAGSCLNSRAQSVLQTQHRAPWQGKRLSYLNYRSSSLHNLLGRGVTFLTLQMGKERDPRFDGFIRTVWTVREVVHLSRRLGSRRKSFLDLPVHSQLFFNPIGNAELLSLCNFPRVPVPGNMSGTVTQLHQQKSNASN